MCKKLTSLILLSLLSGCSPIYKVGDCILEKGEERWEPSVVEKILEVGQHKYRYAFLSYSHPGLVVESSFNFRGVEYNTKKVECPEVLKKYGAKND